MIVFNIVNALMLTPTVSTLATEAAMHMVATIQAAVVMPTVVTIVAENVRPMVVRERLLKQEKPAWSRNSQIH